MKKSKILAIFSILLIVAILVLPTGCSNNETGTESNRWLELLNVLPANETTYNFAYLWDDAYMVEIVDKYPQAGFPLFLNDIAGTIPLFGDGLSFYSDEAWLAELGFVSADVDKTVYAGLPPLPLRYQAGYGRFDRTKIDNAVKNGPYKVVPEIVNYQGYQFYSWGDDNQISLKLKTPVRPLGIGNRMALIDNYIFLVPTTNKMQEMIDSYANKINSLADIKSYQQLAGTLANANTFRAFFSSASYSISSIKETYKDVFTQPENISDAVKRFVSEVQNPDIPQLKPFEAIATGVGIDDKGYYLIIALYNPSASVAKENATLLEQRIKQSTEPFSGKYWQDISSEIKVSYQGQVTIAKLYGEAAKHWDDFAVQGSGMVQPLIIHE
jgi:hypothetical protein